MPFKRQHPLYIIWREMKRRCYNPKFKQYKDYGGRGIKVCPQWINNFKQFVKDMGEKPEGTSLDRINNDLNYTPKNCQWSTRRVQQRNQRRTRKIRIDGIWHVAADLADIAGVKVDTIINRANVGLPYLDIIRESTPSDGAIAAAKKRREATHCMRGHEFTAANTYIVRSGGRKCRKCHALRELRKRHSI